ncbi:hypothetical protein E2C01_087872 [Portunus trituberculatus]|uniref:Uncharacterized protein n=1 Tax=Portunus trituberculatus TaxID=210409 RepID=A0A5B7JF82_PORTR|nr:hypothetical protein [Portunus trituberculatus]
MHVWHRRTY